VKLTRTIITWLCGLWAFGLGARYTVELLASDGWIQVPRDAGYGVNLWFDFIPLALMGLIVAFFETKALCKRIFGENAKMMMVVKL